MKIQDFYFDVAERPLALATDMHSNHLKGYKAIVAPQNDRDSMISIVKDSYKLVTNRELIMPFLDEIQSLNARWYIDKSHSFVAPNRMRLQITFPDLYLSDSESKIPLSVYLHNSYDQSEGIRLYWGAIRAICTNGMVLGDLLGSFYGKHTQGLSMIRLRDQFDQVTERITKVENRIRLMESKPVRQELFEDLQKSLGKRRLEEIIRTDTLPDKSTWDLYNDITYYISHDVEVKNRANLQLKVSQAFAL
jgi:hypothetical protein